MNQQEADDYHRRMAEGRAAIPPPSWEKKTAPRETKIRECPLCGEADAPILESYVPNGYGQTRYRIWCQGCTLMTPGYLAEREALDRWNRRAPSPAHARVVRALEDALGDTHGASCALYQRVEGKCDCWQSEARAALAALEEA